MFNIFINVFTAKIILIKLNRQFKCIILLKLDIQELEKIHALKNSCKLLKKLSFDFFKVDGCEYNCIFLIIYYTRKNV
jgi:hypothetical protein